jgi:hypothetical protein
MAKIQKFHPTAATLSPPDRPKSGRQHWVSGQLAAGWGEGGGGCGSLTRTVQGGYGFGNRPQPVSGGQKHRPVCGVKLFKSRHYTTLNYTPHFS